MLHLDLSADELVSALLGLSASERVCLLDSGGVRHLGAHLLIAGIGPVETIEILPDEGDLGYRILDDLTSRDLAAIFTISYDHGARSLGIASKCNPVDPAIFVSLFEVLVIHDYNDGSSRLVGNAEKFAAVRHSLENAPRRDPDIQLNGSTNVRSDFSQQEYLDAVVYIQERIRCGDTYQTNLTRQLTADLPPGLSPAQVFARLRRHHPSAYSAFIDRGESTVVSASPERFFRIFADGGRIVTSPIKGTRPRGSTPDADVSLRTELLSSTKDRAENTMIVDLLRNDLGRVCEFGSVTVDRLCEIEEHPTLFHLVSTISGDLRPDTQLSDVLDALFPCGSITGAPKISTMKIIDEVERSSRGLSMGAIGCSIPDGFSIPPATELSVAIRTMVIRGPTAVFNVGGGIVIDSDPASEYEETRTKAKALLAAIGAEA